MLQWVSAQLIAAGWSIWLLVKISGVALTEVIDGAEATMNADYHGFGTPSMKFT
ncbi:hypothetical protein P5705_18230 [Pseudomonas entomophila]|uniref:hypothetical protein n=1 Tax=Pseudomonas entomophila TaxID=312306 RepID=UPI002405C197|nr:hypothetical protein [Pseudomonas entomophila]MDF9619588.1 hypothetical protein [Pseudomonas entomophila]